MFVSPISLTFKGADKRQGWHSLSFFLACVLSFTSNLSTSLILVLSPSASWLTFSSELTLLFLAAESALLEGCQFLVTIFSVRDFACWSFVILSLVEFHLCSYESLLAFLRVEPMSSLNSWSGVILARILYLKVFRWVWSSQIEQVTAEHWMRPFLKELLCSLNFIPGQL